MPFCAFLRVVRHHKLVVMTTHHDIAPLVFCRDGQKCTRTVTEQPFVARMTANNLTHTIYDPLVSLHIIGYHKNITWVLYVRQASGIINPSY